MASMLDSPVSLWTGVGTGWSTVDLSTKTTVPAGATGAIIRFYHASVTDHVDHRRPGMTYTHPSFSYVNTSGLIMVGISGTSVDLFRDSASILFYLVGFLGGESTFFTTDAEVVNKTPAATGWQTVDCTANVPSTAIAGIFDVIDSNSPGGGVAIGYRKYGDASAVYSANNMCHATVIVPFNSRQCDFYFGNLTNRSIHLTGYVTQGTFPASKQNISLGVTGAYTDIDLSSYGASPSQLAIIQSVMPTTTYYNHLRKNGDADTTFYGASTMDYGGTFPVAMDGSFLVEGKISNVAVDYYLLGFIGQAANYGNASGSIDTLSDSASMADMPGGLGSLAGTAGMADMPGVVADLSALDGAANGFWCYIAGSDLTEMTGWAVGRQVGNNAAGDLSTLAGASAEAVWMRGSGDLFDLTGDAILLVGSLGNLQPSYMPGFTVIGYEAGKLWQAVMPPFTMAGSQALISYGRLIGAKLAFSGEGKEAGKLVFGTLPSFTMAGRGVQGTRGSLVGAIMPPFSLADVVCYTSSAGTLVGGVMPAFTMAGRAVVVIVGASGDIEAIAICPTTGANSEYTNYKFNSFCVLNGKVYAASDSGLYLLGGTDDAGTAIAAVLETVLDDFTAPQIKGIPQIVFGVDGGPILVSNKWGSTYTTEQEALEAGTPMSKRIKPGRGVRQRYWATKIRNKDGGAVLLDTIEHNLGVEPKKVNE